MQHFQVVLSDSMGSISDVLRIKWLAHAVFAIAMGVINHSGIKFSHHIKKTRNLALYQRQIKRWIQWLGDRLHTDGTSVSGLKLRRNLGMETEDPSVKWTND